MSTLRADTNCKVEIPGAHPGQLFEFSESPGGSFVLKPLTSEPDVKRRTREEIRRAIEENPIPMVMTWEELRAITRPHDID